jgi:hypothetical protein
MRASFAVLPILLLMAGCGGGTGTGAGPEAKISLKYSVDAMPQAADEANKECAAHGRTAKQRDPDPADTSKSVIFDCL